MKFDLDCFTPEGLLKTSVATMAASGLTGQVALANGGTAADNSSQAANKVFASPTSGGAGNMSIRALVDADIPTTLAGKTLTTPTIGSFANANHNHTNSAGGGQLTDAALSAAIGTGKGGTGQDFSASSGLILLTSGAASAISLPTRAEVDARTFSQPAGAAGITSAAQSSQYGGGYSNQTTSANGDEISFPVWLQAGTYTLNVFGSTNTNAAKLDWYIDGSITGITAQDWYSGSQVFNVTKTGSITISTSGLHTIKAKVNGRNASNTTGYYWLIGKVTIF